MKRTAFVCVGSRGRGNALRYHELPAKESGEEYFAFFDSDDGADQPLLKKLFRESISASRLGNPVQYFRAFIDNLNTIGGGIDGVEHLLRSAIIVIAIRRQRDVYLFHNAGVAAVHWDGVAAVECPLDTIVGFTELPLRLNEGQGDLFARFTEELFVLRRFTLSEGNHTLLVVPSRDFVARNLEALRNSVFFPSFELQPDSEVTVEADRSFPAIHWNTRGEEPVQQQPTRGGRMFRRVSIPVAAGTLAALIALLVFFGPWSRKQTPHREAGAPVLLSTEESGQTGGTDAAADAAAPARVEEPQGDVRDAGASNRIAFAAAWRKQFSSPVTSSPQCYRGAVYFGCRDAHLYAFTPDGSLKWKYDAADGIGASPCCISAYVIGADYSGAVFCLDAETGALRWTYTAGERIVSSPQAMDDRVVVGTMGGKLIALNLEEGKQIWSQKLGTEIWATPAVGERYIIAATTDGSLVRLDRDGAIIWRATPGGGILSSPLCIEKADLVVFGSKDTYIYAYSLSKGSLMWRAATGGQANGSPVADGERILAGSDDGYMYALSLSGIVQWKRNLGGAVKSKPLVIGSVAFVTSYGAKIYAIALASGEIVAEHRTDDPVYSSPAHDGTKVYFGSNGGTFHALLIEGGVS